MSKFSDIKKYRKPLTEIDSKIQDLNERMTTTGLVYQSDADAISEISGETPDDKMGDLADTNTFEVADQTGSSPDMSQLTTTDAYGNTVNRLSTPAGSSGLAVIRYGNMGAYGGTYYGVLRSDNTVGDSWLTGAVSGNGGTQSVGDWVNANYNNWTTVTWHYYKTPGMADNVFTPVARNVGPGGNYTLWSASLLVLKNPNFVTRAAVPQTLTRYNLGAAGIGMPYLFRSRGRGSGGASVRSLLRNFGNAARSVGGFVPGGGGKSGKGFRKFLRAAAKAGIPVGDINQATRIYYGQPSAPSPTPSQPSQPQQPIRSKPSPKKPDPTPTPPSDPTPTPDPKPTPRPPGRTPTPTPPPSKPTPKPPQRGNDSRFHHTPPPKFIPPNTSPPPPPGYGDRSKWFDDNNLKTISDYFGTGDYSDLVKEVGNIFSGKILLDVDQRIEAPTDNVRGDWDNYDKQPMDVGTALSRYQEKFKRDKGNMEFTKNRLIPDAEEMIEYAKSIHNAPHITDRIVKEQTAKIKRYNEMIKNIESNLADMRSTLKSEIQRLTGDVAPVKEKFVKGGSVADYLNTYAESHPKESSELIQKHVVDNKAAILKNLKNESSKALTGLAKYGNRFNTAARTFMDFLSGNLPDVVDNNYLGQEYVDSTFASVKMVDDKRFGAGVDAVIGSGQEPEYDPVTDEVVLKFNYDFQKNSDNLAEDPITVGNAFGKIVGALMGGDAILGGEGHGIDSMPIPGAGLAISTMKKVGEVLGSDHAKGRNGEIRMSFEKAKRLNPNFIRNSGLDVKRGVRESFNLNESIEFEQQTGAPIDHVANVMNGIADALELLQLCIYTLDEAKEDWRLPRGQKRYEITNNAEGSIENPMKMYFSRNTNQYLLTNGNTGEAYDPKQDGTIDKFILDNAIKKLEMGGNVATKSVFSNFRYQPQVEVDEDGNINIVGQLHLFNFRKGLSQTIIGQVLTAFDGMVNLLDVNIDDFQRRLIRLYDAKLHEVFPRIVNFDEEIPFVNVRIQIPVEQAELYTHGQYNQPVNESRFQKWKKKTTVEDRFNIGSYEFFLIELASLPEVAMNYLRIELQMQLENALRPANQQMDPKMINVMSMVNANDVYVANNFKENEKLFNKLQQSIKNNIDATRPETYKQPPVKKEEVVVKQRSIKKYLKEHRKKSRPSFLTKKR